MIKNPKGSGGGGGKGGGGGGGRTPVEAPDTLRSIQYANVLDLVSEGEIGGLVNGAKSVYFDDTPLQNPDGTYNFTDVTLSTREGTQSQTSIDGFLAAEAEVPVGVEIKKDIPVVRSITNNNDTAVRVTISVPSLTNQSATTGDINGTNVEIAIDLQVDGGGFIAQELRKIYSSENITIGYGVATNTIDSDKFKVTVEWTKPTGTTEATCTFELQYRLVGEVDWNVQTTHTFVGKNTTSIIPTMATFAFNTNTYSPTESRTFEFELAYGQYEFRTLKTNGSAVTDSGSFIFGTTSRTGIAYGGSVTITGAEAYAPAYTDVISGKTTTKYQRTYRIALPIADQWDIRVRRITDDSTSSLLNNKTYWDSYTEIVDARLSYPNSALVGIQIDAKQFSRIPVRGYEIYGVKIKIPSNYNPLTRNYDGTWDGTFTTAWSDNPAWVLYDIVTNERYGIGSSISESMIDKWTLYSIAQYCDEPVEDGFGGYGPRFTCNLYLQTREEAYKVVANIASVFRSMVFWASGTIYASQDAPKDVTQIFAPANVIDGAFSYTGSAGNVRHTVALVSWNDPEENYLPKIEYVSDAEAIERYGVVQTEVYAIGCTSRGQAHRVGRSIIYSENYETETITFRAGIDSVFVQAGDIISVNDPNRAGLRLGGRVVTATTSSVTIDNAISIESGKTYELSVKLEDGSIETRTLNNSVGSASVLTFDTALSSAPLNYAMWIVSVNDVIAESWRVISITESSKNEVEISALQYRPDKYLAIEQDLVLEPLPVGVLQQGVPAAPTDFKITESLYLAGVGVVGIKATLSWSTSISAFNYSLTYRKDDENPKTITTFDNTIEIFPIDEGTYTFTLYSKNSLGRRSSAQVLVHDILGKTVPPLDVENFQLSPLGTIGLFTWGAATDLDVLVGGKVVFKFSPNPLADWENSQFLANEASGTATTVTLPLQTGIYFAKFVDSSGNYSTNATSIITNSASIISLNFVESIDADPDWSGAMTNVQYNATLAGLQLSSADLWDSDESIDSEEAIDYGAAGIASIGEYEMGSIDLGEVQTSRVSSNLFAYGFDVSDLWDSDELIDSTQLVDGDLNINSQSSIYVRFTDDDPTGTPIWSNWQTTTLADISARAFEFKLILESWDISHNILVESANATVDMPDRIEAENDIVSGTSSYVVTYNKPFMVSPALGLSAENMGTGDYYTLTSKDNTGFTIQFFDIGSNPISRTFDYIAKGY